MEMTNIFLETDEQNNTSIDLFETAQYDVDQFEEESRKTGIGLIAPNNPILSKKLENIDAGLYLFGAESNVGKTALMTNIIYDICSYEENHAYGLFFTLDDSKKEVIPRIVAMNKSIPIGCISKPKRYEELIKEDKDNAHIYTEYLTKRTQGLEELKNMHKHFKIIDTEKDGKSDIVINNSTDIYNYIQKSLIYLKSIDENYKLIIAIDSISDIMLPNEPRYNSMTKEEKKSTVAKMVKKWTKEFNVAIFASIHLKKLNMNRRPVLDDLKDSGEFVYEASVVFLLYSDVGKNKSSAKIYYEDADIEGKRPIIEVDWAKNKKSSYKGRTFYYFAPEYSKTVECNKENNEHYEQLIYEI